MTGLMAELTNAENIGVPVAMVVGGITTAVLLTWFISDKINGLKESFNKSISTLREQIARDLVDKDEIRELRDDLQETNKLAQSNREDVRVLMSARETNPGLAHTSSKLGVRDE